MLWLNERRKILRSIFSFVLHVFYFFSSLCMFVSPRYSNVLGWPLSLTGTLWFKRLKSFDLREATAFLPLEASRFSSAQLIQSRFLRDVFAIGHFVFLLRTKKFKSESCERKLATSRTAGAQTWFGELRIYWTDARSVSIALRVKSNSWGGHKCKI